MPHATCLHACRTHAHTWCGKRSLESLVGSAGNAVALKMHPYHVSCTLDCARLGAATHGFSENFSKNCLKFSGIVQVFEVGFPDLQVVVFAVLALLKFEWVEGDCHLMSLGSQYKPLPSKTCRVVLCAKFRGANLALGYIEEALRASYRGNDVKTSFVRSERAYCNFVLKLYTKWVDFTLIAT